MLIRWEGEVVEGEAEVVPKDPRKRKEGGDDSRTKSGPGPGSKVREVFYEMKPYEYDEHSPGPPPPTAVLITNIPPLTANTRIRSHFSAYGPITGFEAQQDKKNGNYLGIVWMNFHTHDIARKCVEQEHGKAQNPFATVHGGGVEPLSVVMDGEGKKVKALVKEMDRRKKEIEDAKRRPVGSSKESGPSSTATSVNGRPHGGATPGSSGATPFASGNAKASGSGSRFAASLPSRPENAPAASIPNKSKDLAAVPIMAKSQAPPPALEKLRQQRTLKEEREKREEKESTMRRDSRRPGDSAQRTKARFTRPSGIRAVRQTSPLPMSRSPSPTGMPPGAEAGGAAAGADDAVLAELVRNGYDHVKIDGASLVGTVTREEDVRAFFDQFNIDKVLQDSTGWYITFCTADSARKAEFSLNGTQRTLAQRNVTLTTHHPPSSVRAGRSSRTYTNAELVDAAEQLITKELVKMLRKDVMDRIVASDLRGFVAEEKTRRLQDPGQVPGQEPTVVGSLGVDGQVVKKAAGLKALSFKKKAKPKVIEHVVERKGKADAEDSDVDMEGPPRKKLKPSATAKAADFSDSEAEDGPLVTELAQKRATTVDQEDDGVMPAKKKRKVELVIPVAPSTPDSGLSSPLTDSPSPPPKPKAKMKPPPRPPTPPVEPLHLDLCLDDEDMYFARLAISNEEPEDDDEVEDEDEDEPEVATRETASSIVPGSDKDPPIPRKHVSGSARTEGFYKISHLAKSAYVAQYQARSAAAEEQAPVEEAPKPQPVATSSRSNRANARRRVQGMDEMNQLQLAVALSKGETAASATEVSVKFNQLQTRKKHLRFARSPIHDWGLYAMERIAKGEMVIEYVGEVIRAAVADKREKAYERQGIGSSYLFRIDEDLVVDATKKGNLGRLINHSCDPKCTAKIITINGEKKIVIYAKTEIELGDEITYDYHFPIELDKITCLCGTAKCRGYLN